MIPRTPQEGSLWQITVSVTEGSQKGSQWFPGDAQEKPSGLYMTYTAHMTYTASPERFSLWQHLWRYCLEQTLPRSGESSKKGRMQPLTVSITITPYFGRTFCRAYAHFFSLSKEVGRIKNSLFSLYLSVMTVGYQSSRSGRSEKVQYQR